MLDWLGSSDAPPRTLGMLAVIGCLLGSACDPGDTGIGLNLVSEEQVEQMATESWQRIRQETPASPNQAYQQTANQVAANLLRATGEQPRNWEVVVFQGSQANAFALPGRKIGIFEGMFQVAQNEAQLATVIAHEIGHVQADHGEERVNSQVATEGAVQLVSAALQIGDIAYANEIAAALGMGAEYGVMLPYSRNQEREADRTGLTLMAEAGYDPREAIDFWQRMQQQGGARPPAFLSTHPAPGDRVEELEEQMPQALGIYQG